MPPASEGQDFRLSRRSLRAAALPVGPFRVGDELFELRPPRLTDGPAWRATSLREERRLRPAFGSHDEDWSQTVSLTAWADRVGVQRRQADRGLLVPYVLTTSDDRIGGEISFALDPRTAAAEVSVWLAADTPKVARTWAISMALVRLFSLPQRVDRVVAPVAVENPGPAPLFELLGFIRQATARRLRPYGPRLADHDIWWLDRSDHLLSAIGRVMSDVRHEHHDGPDTEPLPSQELRAAQMLGPALRVAGRRLRANPPRPPLRLIHDVDDHGVVLPFDRCGPVIVDSELVGWADIRLDHGTSTLEVWTDLEGDESVALVVARSLRTAQQDLGARRLGWSLRPSSPAQRAALLLGLEREGRAPEPATARGETHELWSFVTVSS